MIKLCKVISIVIICLLLLLSAFLVVVYNKKIDKVPTVQSGDLRQLHALNNKEQAILFVIGDMGRPSEAHANIAKAMERQCLNNKPDALLFLGDNIYDTGVTSVDDPKWDSHLLNFYKSPCLANVKIYAVLGNHDYLGNAQAQVSYGNKNKKWKMPFRYYDVGFGDILSLTGTDMWFPDFCLFSSECMMSFLVNSLKTNQDKAWHLVMGHYPITSASEKTGRHRGNIPGWILNKVLCANDADVYFAGHTHHLEHTVSTSCDMDLVISGSGGGSALYGIRDDIPKETKFAVSKHGFVQLIADKERMQFTFFDSMANNLYQYTKSK